MILVVAIISLLYCLKISKYRIGWDKIAALKHKHFIPKVSVLIAMRNEEDEIKRLISSLKKQIYPTSNFEVIIINDHSTDTTLTLLKQEENQWENLHLVCMNEGEFGKKNAIAKAMDIATGDIIITTDSDCSFTPNWVATMAAYFQDEQIKLVSGPVNFHPKSGVFQQLQALEFASLIGAGAGAIGVGSAIFCNGANMAYRKEVFLEVNDFANDKAVSGDDVFLLHSIKAKYPNSIVFAKEKNVIVTTDALNTFQAFINQRKRWAAKSSGYKDRASIYSSFLVLFTNLIGVFLVVMAFFSAHYVAYCVFFFVLKFLADLYLLVPVLGFFKRKDLIKWILPFEIFYSFYIVLIVILSFTKSFEWKGRIHKK